MESLCCVLEKDTLFTSSFLFFFIFDNLLITHFLVLVQIRNTENHPYITEKLLTGV